MQLNATDAKFFLLMPLLQLRIVMLTLPATTTSLPPLKELHQHSAVIPINCDMSLTW